MNVAGIYMIVNKVNGKRYVGSSRNCARRKSEHISKLRRNAHINKKLQAAWNKYGENSFEFVVAFSVLKADEIEAVEQQFLDEVRAVETGYNLAPVAGNTAGWKASPETRKRMSDAAKRRDNSAQVAAMAEASRGKKRPQYVIDAMQAGRKAKPITDETRDLMAKSARARSRYSDADRERMSQLQDEGVGLREIARRFGTTSHAAIAIYIRDWKNGVRSTY